jgi:hypothetical protein
MLNPSRFQDFFMQLPEGESVLTNSKGEAITIHKDAEKITLSKSAYMSSVPLPTSTERRLNFSYVADTLQNGAFTLHDCWEEAEETHHYPVSYTNHFIVEALLADVVENPQVVFA